jgi:hypothetical protein
VGGIQVRLAMEFRDQFLVALSGAVSVVIKVAGSGLVYQDLLAAQQLSAEMVDHVEPGGI